ncbi:hypothetical protein DL765_006439 [Monosporascus sp. GIB2]|nr:hypothetical protein DL765_006439 [Monosporascus sp. GIB2]
MKRCTLKQLYTGAGIQLHPNAVRVLQDIGVYDKVRSRSVVPLSIILKAYKTGEVLHAQDLLEPADRYGAPLLTLHRAHLRQLLYDEAIAQGVTVRHGVGVDPAGIDLTNGALHLPNLDETFHADLFVGADGGHSVVREAPTGRKPRAIPDCMVVNRLLIDERAIRARPHLRYLVEQLNIGRLAESRAPGRHLRARRHVKRRIHLAMVVGPGGRVLRPAGIESVSVLAHLLGKAIVEDGDDDDDDRRRRVGDHEDGWLWQMPDGPLKDERERELLRETGNPSVGYPNPLADPFFQRWLWGFDAPGTADRAWAAYRRGNVAGRA